MADVIFMNGQDAVWAGAGRAYISIEGNRYNLPQITKLEGNAKKQKKKIPIMGRVSMGNKAGGIQYDGKMSLYYNQSILRRYVKRYQDTGQDFYFDLTVVNEDKTSSVGKQTIILKGCNLDDVVIAKLEAGGDVLTEDASFTFESYEMPEEFDMLNGMEQGGI